MMKPFAEMCDGHLGEISASKIYVTLAIASSPQHLPPYRVVLKVREFQCSQIEKSFEQKINKSAIYE